MTDEGAQTSASNSRTSATQPRRQRPSVIVTAAVYFVLVFAVGLALGPIRVLWLEPVLGATIAVLCETPFLVAAMIMSARWAPRWTKLTGGWPVYATVGLVALLLQQFADLAVGFGLRGMTLADQMALFTTPPGYIYAANLICFAGAPLLMRRKFAAGHEAGTPN